MKRDQGEMQHWKNVDIEALAPGLHGDPKHRCLYVAVSTGGVRAWTYRYTNESGHLRQLKLGVFPGMSKERAVAAWEDLNRARERGIDPSRERRESRTRAQAANYTDQAERYTTAKMVEHYLAEHVEQARQSKGARMIRRLLEHDLGAWASMPAIKLTVNGTVHDRIVAIRKRAPAIAASFKRDMAAAWDHAQSAGRIDSTLANPFREVLKRKLKQKSRERTLTDRELQQWLEGLPSAPVSRTARDAWMLTLLTGCRSGQIIAARWADVDLKRGTLAVLEQKGSGETGTRNREAQLSRQAIALLRSRQEPNSGTWVFPLDKVYAKGSINGHVDQRALQEHARNWRLGQTGWRKRDATRACKVQEWTTHDLRRTLRTGVARLGCQWVVGELILGHVLPGVTGIYDQHKYDTEQREYLQKWADHLEALAAPKVVALGRKARA